jgi:hypothetical protein
VCLFVVQRRRSEDQGGRIEGGYTRGTVRFRSRDRPDPEVKNAASSSSSSPSRSTTENTPQHLDQTSKMADIGLDKDRPGVGPRYFRIRLDVPEHFLVRSRCGQCSALGWGCRYQAPASHINCSLRRIYVEICLSEPLQSSCNLHAFISLTFQSD